MYILKILYYLINFHIYKHFPITNKTYLHNNENSENVGIDQLIKIIKELREDPNSRRILMTTFNPAQVSEGVLYPCHSIVIQFQVSNQDKLNCTMYTRSSDLLLGIPFNIASTALFVHIIAKLTNKIAGMLNIVLGDYHIYEEHYNAVIEQLNRTPYIFPKLNMSQFTCLEDVENSKLDDYKLEGYISHDAIKAKMIA